MLTGGADEGRRDMAEDEAHPNDATEPEPEPPTSAPVDPAPVDPWGGQGGETQEVPAAPPPAAPAPPPAGPSGTSILPAIDDEVAPDQPGRWSARAQVAPPDVADTSEHYGAEWQEPPRGPLVPILVTVCILLVLALAGLGVWLLLSDRGGGTPTPTPSVPAPTSAAPPTTTKPAPTTPQATTSAAVTLPDLKGTDPASAENTLKALGFKTNRRNEVSADVPAGFVVGTDPPAGTTVIPGATINIIVSTGTPTPSPKPTSPKPSPGHS
jgi:hypothetical protein